MIQTSRIGSRCLKVAETLDTRAADEIAVLRTARVLKNIHSELQRALWETRKTAGHTDQTDQAEVALESMEQDLRRALLGYPALRGPLLRENVVRALDQSFTILDLLGL
ncbi:MAG TPA: hypothetical protein VF898_10000 [Chloroflexota bacterium]